MLLSHYELIQLEILRGERMREWLIEARKNAEMTQKEIAIKSGISQNHYSAIENGNRHPSPKVSKKLAAVLGIDWTMFYNETAERGCIA